MWSFQVCHTMLLCSMGSCLDRRFSDSEVDTCYLLNL